MPETPTPQAPNADRAMERIIELIYSPDAPLHLDVEEAVRIDPENVARHYAAIVEIVNEFGMAGLEHDARAPAIGDGEQARASTPEAPREATACDPRFASMPDGPFTAPSERGRELTDEERASIARVSGRLSDDLYDERFSSIDMLDMLRIIDRLTASSGTTADATQTTR